MEPIEQLRKLYQVERDVLEAFDEAIQKVENPQLVDHLRRFHKQRNFCLRKLAGLLAQENEEIPALGFSFEDSFEKEIIEVITALRASLGDTEALEALKLVSEISLHSSGEAMEELGSFPDLEESIQGIHEIQRDQLDFLKEQLSSGSGHRSGNLFF